MNAEETKPKFDAAEAMTGMTVDEVRHFHHTKAVAIVLVPTVDTALALDDTKLHLMLTTSEPELIHEFRLGRTIGFSDDPAVDSQELSDLQASGFGDAMRSLGHGILKLVGVTVSPDQLKATEAAVVAFVGKDVLSLAIDAVSYVSKAIPGITDVAAREAAKQKLIADAKAAGKDLDAFAVSTLNFVIEGALQIAIAKGLTAAAAAVGGAVAAAV